jgi:hypothetical protein
MYSNSMTTNQPLETRQPLPQLPDETAIQFLAAQFSDAANRRDAGLFQEIWAPEGVWEIGPPVNVRSEGRGQMGAFLLNMLDQWDFFVQLTTSGTVAVSGERAKARFYINEIARSKTGKGNYNLSLYRR